MMIPRPKQEQKKEGSLRGTPVFPATEEGRAAARMLSLFLPALAPRTGEDATVRLTNAPLAVKGAYRLSVEPAGIAVIFGEAEGLRNAIASLAALYTDGGFSFTEISDAPAYPYRSVMLDLARGYVELPILYEYLVRAARLKYNYVHLHLMDGESYPMGSNYGNVVLTNIGSIRNKGIEFSVNGIPVQTNDWSVQVGFNCTFQDSRFTKLNSTDDPNYAVEVGDISKGTGSKIGRHMVGYEPYTYFAPQQIYDENGHPIQNALVDRDNDDEITLKDFRMTGKSPLPNFFYGINFKASYKDWDFGFNGHGTAGNYLFNDFASEHSTSRFDTSAGNIPNLAMVVKRTGWTEVNSGEQSYSDYFIEDASFFRLDDINLGYTFRGVGRWETDMRLAFGVQNVFVLTGYSGMDPECSAETGIDNTVWPRPRTYSLRLNVTF